MKKNRIAYFIDCSINNGGAPKSSLILASEMAKRNYDVFLVMPKSIFKEKTKNIKVIQVDRFSNEFPFLFKNPIKSIELTFELLKIVKKIKPNIIHAQMPRSARALGFLKKMNLINDVKLVFTEREYVSDLRRIYKTIYKFFIINNYDKIICLSKKAMPFWIKNKAKSVVNIYNPGGKIYDAYCSKYRIRRNNRNSKRINIIFVGRMIKNKRWDFVVEIIKSFTIDELNNFNFIIVASTNSLEEKRYLNSLKKKFDSFQNLYFYENLTNYELSSLYYSTDIHVITSIRESFGRTAIEAMSRKNVVIATNVGALEEILDNKSLILEPKVETFHDKIMSLSNNREELVALKNEMYKKYNKNFCTDKIADEHAHLYENLLKEK